MGNITLTTGITNNGQYPVDGKVYFLTQDDVKNRDINTYAFSYYERMIILFSDSTFQWQWREVLTGDIGGLLDSDYTYPSNINSNGIDYSNRTFNFFKIDYLKGIENISYTDVVNTFSVDQTFIGNVISDSFIKGGGTSLQFLKADGSVDSNVYALTSDVDAIDTSEWVSYSGTRSGGDLIVSIGDYDNSGDKTKIFIDDGSGVIKFSMENDNVYQFLVDEFVTPSVSVYNDSGFKGGIHPNNLTEDRAFQFPDASGIIALTSDLSGYLLNTTDTFAGDLTIDGKIKVNTIEVPNRNSSGVDDDTAWIHLDTSGSNGGNDSGVTLGKRASEDNEMANQPYVRIRSNGAFSLMTENIEALAPWAQSYGVYEGYTQADKLANFGYVGQGTDVFYLSAGFKDVNGGGPSWWNGQSYLLMHKTGKVEFGQDATGDGTSVKTESQSEPNAKLVLARGTTDDAPLLFKSGPLLSTTRNGAMEYSSSDGKIYFTENGTRTAFSDLGGSLPISITATSDNEDLISLMPYNTSLASFKIGYEDGLRDGAVGVNGDIAFRTEFSGVSKDAIRINRQSGDVSFINKVTAPNLGIADITDSKDLTTKEYVESLQGEFELKTDSTTTITLSSADKGKVISTDSSSAITVTIDTASLTDAGDIAYIDQIGIGEITFVAGIGVTLQVNAGRELITDGQFSRVAIHKMGTSTYRVFGELKAI